VVITSAVATAPSTLLSLSIVSPLMIFDVVFLLIIPSASFDCQSNKAQRICEMGDDHCREAR
jgi:hypothetical protein